MKKKLLASITVLLSMFTVSGYAQSYCVPSAPTSTIDSDILNVELSGDNYNISNLNPSTCPSVAGPEDYTATDSADISIGSLYSLNITFGDCNGGSVYAGFGKAWIDWNNDGDFTDTLEELGTWSGSPAASGTTTFNSNMGFVVPSFATLGATRMRVMQREGGTAATTTPCAGFTYGGVEDYTVVITNTPPPCPKPGLVSFSGFTSTSVNMSFVSTGTSFPIEYGPTGFVQGTGQLDTATSTSFAFTGLFSNTAYDVYIKNDCSLAGNGSSAWVGPYTFTTLCSSQPEGYTNNFDGLVDGDQDPCWSDLGYGGNYYTEATEPSIFSTIQASSSPNVYNWYSSTATSSYLITPNLEGLDGDSTQIKFKAGVTSSSATTLYVGTMSDPSDTATITWHDTIVPGLNTWNSYTILFQNVPAGDAYVVFGRIGQPGYVSVYIDDFVFEGIPNCLPPTALNSTALSATSGMVSWAETGTFDIEYGPSGFTQGTGMMIAGATNPDTLINLFPNTCYDVYIRQNCGNGSVSPWELTTFCTPCLPASMPYTEDFTSWPPACFTLSKTGSWDWDHESVGGHAYAEFYWNSSGSATMTTQPITISQKAQVKIKWAHLYSSSYPDDQFILRSRVLGGQWDTLVNLKGPSFNSPNAGNTTAPSLSDFTQELIYLDSAIYVGNDAEFEIIGITDWGPNLYVDDFVVEPVPSCPDPTQIAASNIQGYQADISWMATSGADYVIEYGLQGFVQGTGGGTIDTTNATSYTISGLTPTTCYDVYVMTLCGANGVSQWVGPYSFCTTVSCPAPTGINLVGATTTSATLNWTSGGASNYNYIIGAPGITPATGTPIAGTTMPLTITGLTAATVYEFYVQDSCGQGDASFWTGPFSFSTACNTFVLNYTEDWSNWGSAPAPTCWDVGGGTDTVLNTNGVAEFNFWSWPSGQDAYLTSPNISITQKARLKVKWSSNGSTTYNDTMYIMAKPVTAMNWDTLAVWGNPDCMCTTSSTVPSSTPVDSIFTLDSNYVGSEIQVRFYGNSGYGPDFFVHQVDVEVDPNFASCPAPQNLTATNVGPTSADLGFTSTASSFQIAYGTGITNPALGTMVVTPNNPYALSGLQANTSYSYFVRSICGTGDTSFWSGPYTFTTSCSVFSMPFVENWSNWTPPADPQCWSLQGGSQTAMNNNGVLEFGFWGWSSGQAFVTSPLVNVSQPASLRMRWSSTGSTTYSDTVIVLAKTMSATNWDTVAVWGELDCNCGATNTAYSATPVDSILPLNASYVGSNIQVRVIGISDYGPDFFIHELAVEPPSACPLPTNGTATNIECDNITIDWTSDAGTVSSVIVYDTAGFDPLVIGTWVMNASSPQTITGLQPGTAYDFYVMDSCANGMSFPILITDTTVSGPLPTLQLSAMQTDTTATTAEWTFDASNSTDYTDITWEFGDGSTNGMNATEVHDYMSNQPYTVTVTLTNGCGSVDSTFTINVQGISIEESDLAKTLDIFPNPSAGNVSISFNLPETLAVGLQVTDALGRTVFAKDLGKIVGEKQVELDLADQPSGVYFIRLETQKGFVVRKLSLQTK